MAGGLAGLSGEELYDRLHPKPKAATPDLPTPDTAAGRGHLLYLSHHGNREARKVLADWRAEHPNPDGDDAA